MISAGCWSVFFLLPWCTFALLAKWLYIRLMKQNDCKIPVSSKQAINQHAGVWSRKRRAFRTMSCSHIKRPSCCCCCCWWFSSSRAKWAFFFISLHQNDGSQMRKHQRDAALVFYNSSHFHSLVPLLYYHPLSPPSFPLVFSALLSVYQAGLTGLVCCR